MKIDQSWNRKPLWLLNEVFCKLLTIGNRFSLDIILDIEDNLLKTLETNGWVTVSDEQKERALKAKAAYTMAEKSWRLLNYGREHERYPEGEQVALSNYFEKFTHKQFQNDLGKEDIYKEALFKHKDLGESVFLIRWLHKEEECSYWEFDFYFEPSLQYSKEDFLTLGFAKFLYAEGLEVEGRQDKGRYLQFFNRPKDKDQQASYNIFEPAIETMAKYENLGFNLFSVLSHFTFYFHRRGVWQ